MEEKEREVEPDEVWSWGAGTDRQLATTKLQDEHLPQLVPLLSFTTNPIAHLACGGAHVIALTKYDGKVLTWGRGTSGQLGHGDMQNCLHPLPVKSLESSTISCVSAGWNHSGFVSDSGRVFTCGEGAFGQLGHGDNHSQLLPMEVMAFGSKPAEQIACGMRHTLVLLRGHPGNQIYGFGVGKRGQLGASEETKKGSFNIPQIVSGFEGVKIASVIANGDQSAALTVDGHLHSWGKGFQGKSDAHRPVTSPSHLKITQAALGWNHALVLTDNKKVFMLGGNNHGMLSALQGTPLTKCSSNKGGPCQEAEDHSYMPILREVPGLHGIKVVDIAAGAEHSALVTDNGMIMTWGWGEHGQLGLGNEEDRRTPDIVSFSGEFINNKTGFNVYCGSGFTFAIVRKSAESQT